MFSVFRSDFWKQLLSGFLLVAVTVTQIYAGLPIVNYEAPVFQNGSAISSYSGWQTQNGQATVVDGEGFNGSQALKLHKGTTQNVLVTRDLSMPPNESIAFIDFRIKPAAVPSVGATSTIVVNGTHLSFVKDAEAGTGVLYALDGNDDRSGNEEWIDTAHRQALAGALSYGAQDWVRVSIRQDYTEKEWDLYVDGVLYAAGMGFYQRGTALEKIDFYGCQVADVYIDELQTDETNMLFVDTDKDGIPDDYENSHGMNPNVNDRWVLNSEGKTNIGAYLESVWPEYDSSGSTSAGAQAPALANGGGTIPPITILSEHEVVGSLNGAFDVGGDGSANYNVPIDLPAGSGGMVPKLSIAYSSSGGNGLMGIGWDVSGLKGITRGPATRAKDGFIDTVDFDANDRFYLDGERLVAVKNASGQPATLADYGQDGTEYRTENDGFARITSHGQLGSGPHHWEVETKAGLLLSFGNCSTSCVQNPSGQGALVWSMNKAQDTVGNYFEVTYHQDGGNPGESIDYRPNEIRYTGNASAGVSPYNLVKFVYADRPDPNSAYRAGVKVHSTKRLTGLEVRHAPGGSGSGQLIHRYEMMYCDQDSSKYPNGWSDFLKHSQTRKSLLSSITKIGSDGTALPATQINWDERYLASPAVKWGSSEKTEQNHPSWSGSENSYSVFLDINGDSLPDRVDHRDFDTGSYGIWVSLNDGEKFLPKTKWLEMSVEEQNFPKWADHADTYSTFMDINSDGLPDRVNHKNYATGEFGIWVALNTGSSFGPLTKWMSSSKEEQNYIEWSDDDDVFSSFIDMNADGLPDRVDHLNYQNNEYGVWVRLNTGSGFANPVKWLAAVDEDRSAQTWSDDLITYNTLMDINADGLPDKVEHKNYSTGQYGLWVRLNTGSGFGPLQNWQSMPQQQQNYISWGDNSDVLSMFIDINADGLPDRVHHKNYATGENALWVSLNTGKSFEPLVKWLTCTETAQSRPQSGYNDDVLSMFMDVNGDGLPDRVDHRNYDYNDDRALWVRINTGSGFMPQVKWLESREENQTFPLWNYETDALGMFIDMNGDGLVDRVTHMDFESEESGIFVYLNAGNSFGYSFHQRVHVSTHQAQNYVSWIDDGNTYSDFVDMNGDGLLDRVDHKNYSTNDDGIWVSLNTGNGYGASVKWLDMAQEEQNYLYWNDGDHGSVYSRFIDMNGDGLPDRVDHKNYSTNEFGLWVRLNNGSGYGSYTKWLGMPVEEQNYPRWGSDAGNINSDLIDVNGDGKPDRVDHYNYETNEHGLWVRLNTGTGFGSRTKWLDSSDFAQNHPVWRDDGNILSEFRDMNGDGMLDRVDHKHQLTGDYGIYVRINSGSGFAAAIEWLDMPEEEQNFPYWNDNNYGSVYSCLMDMNGDGLPDRVDHKDYATGDYGLWVRLNTGNGFGTRTKWLDANNEEKACPSYLDNGNILSDLRDMNGDGLPDRVEHKDEATEDYAIWVRLNTGSGFGGKFKWLDVIENEQNYLFRNSGDHGSVYNNLVDLNGDGLLDHVMHFNNKTNQYGLWVQYNSGGSLQMAKTPSIRERVSSIVDGFGAEIRIEYQRTNDLSHVTNSTEPVYTKGDVSSLPARQVAIQDGRWVVSRYAEQDGMGGWRWKRQHYGDLRYDLANEVGFGFGWMKVVDEPRGHVSYTEYNQVFPYQGTMSLSESSIADGTVISKMESSYAQKPFTQGAGGKIYYPYQSGATEWKYDIDGFLLSSSATSQTVDGYGSLLSSVVTLTDAVNGTIWTTTTSNVYENIITANKWHLGRVVNASVTSSGTGMASKTKTTAFTYDSSSGLIATETIEPGHAKAVTTSRGRDAFGNVTSLTTSAAGVASRTSYSTYDAYGRFIVYTENALGHSASMAYDQQRSLLMESTDANGLRTSFSYDVFGTKILTTHPHGAQTAEITKRYTGSEFPEITFIRKSQSSGSPPATIYLDAQGRERYAEAVGFDGQTIRKTTEYDVLGRQSRVSLPYFAGSSPAGWQSVIYDEVDRVISTTHPDGTCDCATYNGFTTVMTNRSGQVRTRLQNAKEELLSVTDHTGNVTTFEYFVDSQVKKATGSGGHTVENTYDIFGNKLTTTDSDTGLSTSVYDALGQVTSVTDAKNQSTGFVYDAAGRPLTKVSPEETVTYTYDTAPGASLGKVAAVSSTSGYQENFTYDSYGRSIAVSRTIAGETFTGQTWYDALGRVSAETDAGGLSLRHHYNANGFEEKITEAYTGVTYWKALEYDASGRLVREELGNGVQTTRSYNQLNGTLTRTQSGVGSATNLHDMEFSWDNVGNLQWRKDHILNLTENFAYDSLNRVTSAHVTGQSANSFTFDATGNILSKTGTGTYHYTDSARPHRLTSITKSGSAVRNYTYDANGAVISDGRRSYTWTSFNKVATIHQAAASVVNSFGGAALWSAGTSDTAFEYDASNTRTRQTLTRTGMGTNATSTQRVTTYVGSYEREEHYNSSSVLWQVRHRHMVGGFLQIKRTETSGQSGITEEVSYFLKDHLGSTSAVLDASGNVVERPSFDAWGKTRNATTWADVSADTQWLSSAYTNRGYTGHEQLDESGLIHMNGRIYDPEVGRFLSPDPYIQDAEHSQNFNRYAYVLNNPLSYTDPSGHFFKSIFKIKSSVFKSIAKIHNKAAKWVKENWQIVVVVIISILTWYVGGAAWGLGLEGAQLGATVGAVTGAAGAAINGGDWGDILKGALVGGVTGYITGGALSAARQSGDIVFSVAGHGIVGGVSNELMGGKFQDGFLSAAFSAGFGGGLNLGNNPYAKTVASAIVGGTASAIGGGKFANGAFSAAFRHVLTGGNTPSSNEPPVVNSSLSIIQNIVMLPFKVIGAFNILGNMAVGMRNSVVAQSKLDIRNSSGISAGYRSGGLFRKLFGLGYKGDNFKTAGTRFNPQKINDIRGGPFGGVQGGPGRFFGISYSKGDFLDYVHEAFGGPHDYLSSWSYDSNGNNRPLNPLLSTGRGIASGALLVPSAVFVGASLLPTNSTFR